ncbi:MAG: CCA tRNA nucleotidyltransferase [Methanotrichaceae archaeon]
MTSPPSLSELLDQVLDRVRPTYQERKRLKRVAVDVIARIDELAQTRKLECKTLVVGSAARNTWLAGDHDLDIFIGMPEDSDLDIALDLARKVALQYEERYAEHAYVHAFFEGFELDLVPCYLVKDAAHIKSAVDRTPFHSQYVSSKIRGLEDDVLLLKQFMKGIGVYGSELRVGGFSGYLAELLVICYGSFLEVLQNAGNWNPGEFIDLEGHSARSHDDPLVMVDPVDPKRNVAAALSLDNMFQFAAAARCFLRHPDMNFFFPPEIKPLSDEELLRSIQNRGSTSILIEFAAPDLVEDVIFPQLRKAEQSIRSLLDRNGFSVLRSDADWHQNISPGSDDETDSDGDKTSVSRGVARIFFELEIGQLPEVHRLVGPPAWKEGHVERFLSCHQELLSGPYLENGHVVVEVKRKYTTATQLLSAQIFDLSLGEHLNHQVQKGYKICANRDLLKTKDQDFRKFMSKYFSAQQKIC